MKKKLKLTPYALLLMICLIIMACQEEERVSIAPTDNIPKDSQLAKAMQNVVTHDGSYDDVVDLGNCYSINLPYSIVLNTVEVVIDEIDDYANIGEQDDIQIIYPITITTHDHVKEFVLNDSELAVYAASCVTDDDDIECIDFLYPIGLSLFNTETNSINTLEMGHDSEFYKFMQDADEKILLSINYPIQLRLHNEVDINATHNTELLNEILNAAGACDEND